MKNRVISIVVALSTFCLGCALTSLNVSYVKTARLTPAVEIQVKKRPLLDGIQATMRACGNGYSQGYELPNGKKLGEGNSCYSSFIHARREMELWLKKADRIIETVAPSKYMNESRSERVVASFPKDEFGDEGVTVLWTHGECIHWISAPDLDYALEFENSRFNPYKFDRERGFLTVNGVEQEQDLSRYDKLDLTEAGPLTANELSEETARARARTFLWDHWRDRKPCVFDV